MNASIARRITSAQHDLICWSAPRLTGEPTPLRPPMATAPLASGLTLAELTILNRIAQSARRVN